MSATPQKLPGAATARAGRSGRRGRLAALALLVLVPVVSAEVYYATPTGAGRKDGCDWANAGDLTALQGFIDRLNAGDVLRLGSGTYESVGFTLTGSGEAARPKAIVGVDTGAGVPLLRGTWSEAEPRNVPTGGGAALRFAGTASYWSVRNLRVTHHASAIALAPRGSYSHLAIDAVHADTVRDGFVLVDVANSSLRDCVVRRHTKKGFRLGGNVCFVRFEHCEADANGGDDAFPNEAFPNGFFSGPEPGNHDITYQDCVARNQRMPRQPSVYWNGDGFSSEAGSHQFRYIRCRAFDNHDAGFDDKARATTYEDCIALGNKRGFRCWGNEGVMANCLAAYCAAWGDMERGAERPMPAYGLWVAGTIVVTRSTFHGAADVQVFADAKGRVQLNDCLLGSSESAPDAVMVAGNVVLNGTIAWPHGRVSGADLIAPSRTWTGTPPDAFDSRSYAPQGKGYRGATDGRTR